MHELRALNARVVPEEKLACLTSACAVLYKALAQHARRTAGAGAPPASADDFLPALMYAVLQAAPPRLASNIAYVERFRDSDQLVGVAGYCLTNLRSCVQYLRSLDAAALGMDAAAFSARCAAASQRSAVFASPRRRGDCACGRGGRCRATLSASGCPSRSAPSSTTCRIITRPRWGCEVRVLCCNVGR